MNPGIAPRDRERILSSGFDGYLSKPINAKALADEIERILFQRNHPDAGSKQSEGDAEQKKRAAGAPGSLKT